jgi:hypothetical protein
VHHSRKPLELLTASGSVFVQISDENVHHVRELFQVIYQALYVSVMCYVVKRAAFVSSSRWAWLVLSCAQKGEEEVEARNEFGDKEEQVLDVAVRGERGRSAGADDRRSLARLGDPNRRARLGVVEPDVQPNYTWRVDEVLPDGALAFLYGMKGSLKTFAGLDLAERVALGMPWRGHRVERGPVVYVAAEDAEGVLIRHRAWLDHHGLADNPMLDIIRGPVNLMDGLAVQDLADFVRDEQKKLVIIDTLHRSMGAGQGSEMSDTDTAAVVAAAGLIQDAYYKSPEEAPDDPDTGRLICLDADGNQTDEYEEHMTERWEFDPIALWAGRPTVILVHHPNQRTNTLRGHGGFYGAADTILRMTRRKDGTSTMWCEKQKNWVDGWTLKFALREVVKSAVITDAAPIGRNDEMILRSLEERDGQTWGELAETSGVPKGSVNRTLARLIEAGDASKDDDERYWLA